MAQLKLDDIRIVVSSDRMQAQDRSFFRVAGVEPEEMDILVLKSANHYRADFEPIAGGIINVDAPSAIIEDPSKIAYTKLRDGVRLKGLDRCSSGQFEIHINFLKQVILKLL